jgi:hypothetical protein
VKTSSISLGGTVLAALLVLAGPAPAQDAPPSPQDEGLAAPDAMTPPAAAGPQWRVFSRSATSAFLIDLASVRPEADGIAVKIARVPLASPAGDLTHAVDDFAVRCAARQSRLTASTEAYEDGELTGSFAADEPWGDIRPGSFDEAIHQIGCGEATPSGDPFASVRAFIEAGRP